MSDISDLLDVGLAHHKAGRLQEADQSYRQALNQEPGSAEANHLTGLLAFQMENLSEAATCFERAVAAEPDNVKYLGNLGAVWLVSERAEDALGVLERAMELDPESVDVLNNLAAAHRDLGRFDDAIGIAERAVTLRPDDAELQTNYAVALLSADNPDTALAAAQKATTLAPGSPEAQNALGSAYLALRRRDDAIKAFQAAVEVGPNYADAARNLAFSYQEAKRLDLAAEVYSKATVKWPEDAAAHAGLARTQRMMGRPTDAIASYRTAVALSPSNRRYHSNLLFCLLGSEDQTGQTLLAEHRAWQDNHAAKLEPITPRAAITSGSDKRLKIGYVSADFRNHPVGKIAHPVIAAHDSNSVEIFCYSGATKTDALTGKIQSACDRWRPINNMMDEAVASLIAEDGIDILVDLSGHSAGNRLAVFARKPAPVQASWMGYLSTTGLDAIDYYIGDDVHTPAEFEEHFSESVFRLDRSLTCFDPPADAPTVGPLPAATSGAITFGCFGNPGKITDFCLSVWADLLKSVDGSRLILRYQGYEDSEVRASFKKRFSEAGIEPERVTLEGSADFHSVLETYNRVDIALDTYPYSGTMTTMEALWMGVPVITLAGDRTLSRQAAGQLHAAGYSEFVANSTESFLGIATSLVGDIDRLSSYRSEMRDRLKGSSLCDSEGLAKALEVAYREMWSRTNENSS
ncbi:MAG: hypothetical protein CMM52_14875 [Rhodospirillaceae bacterium]|nr:hypothetical protein [Rhodospirillaceae bacterium]|tara:strand:- start:2344 stop:4416 length:2073 start_codon:yes stop_codon:yes gene_type:complete